MVVSTTEFGWNRTDRTIQCYKCEQSIHASLNWFIPDALSVQSLVKQIQCELRAVLCPRCSNIYRCCGAQIELQDDESEFSDDNSYFELDVEPVVEIYHCQESQLYIVAHLLLLLEKIVDNDNVLIKLRTSKTITKHSTGVGYAKQENVKLVLQGQNDIAQQNTELLIVQLLKELIMYLPDTDRIANTADLVPHPDLLKLLGCSILGPLIKRYLKGASLSGLCNVGKALLQVCSLLANHEHMVSFLYQPLNGQSTLLSLALGEDPQNLETNSVDSFLDYLQDLNTQGMFLRLDDATKGIAEEVGTLYDKLSIGAPEITKNKRIKTEYETKIVFQKYDIEMSEPPLSVTEEYIREMKRLSFKQGEMKNGNSAFFEHSMANQVEDCPQRSKAIYKDIALLSTSLPIYYTTSAFAVVAEERMDLVKVCISGPEGTPYANGLYFFDIAFPASYPQLPPKFKFLTTGNGQWRANPNLYNCGKVCLSLLNTWAENQWIPNTSTLLQVIVSIQSMIFVNRPYFNEPSFGDPTDSLDSIKYNETVRLNVVKHAMVGILENPPRLFEDVVRTHFKLKKDRIVKQVEAWTSFQALGSLPATLQTLLDSL